MTAEDPGAGPGPRAAPQDGAESGADEHLVVRDNRRSRRAGSAGKHAASDPADPADSAGSGGGPPAGPPEGEPAAAEAAAAEQAGEPAGTASAGGAPAGGGLGAELAALRSELDERTRDLQRVTAEYANYRKRVDRDKALATEEATAAVFRALLPVLDDLDRAREHGELVEGVAAVVDQLVATAGKFGLTAFGEPGDPFDPTRHEAVAHQTSPEVTEPTCIDVLRRGYLLGDRLLRPAMVAVADPGEPGPPADPGRPGTPEPS